MGIFQQLHERLFFLGSIFNRSDTGNRSQVLHDIDNQIMKQKTTMLGKCIKNMPIFFSQRELVVFFGQVVFLCRSECAN